MSSVARRALTILRERGPAKAALGMGETGRLTPLVEWMIVAEHAARHPRAVRAVYGALSAPRHARVRSRLYEATVGSEPITIACVGRDRRFRSLPAGLESSGRGPLVSTWTPRGLDALTSDVVAAEIHPLAASAFRRAGWTVVPELVRWRAPTTRLPAERPTESLRSDLRKAAAFRTQIVARPTAEDACAFEREMVGPHARSRFGEAAWDWSAAYRGALRRRAALLLVTRGDVRVAGAYLVETPRGLWVALAGVRDGDPALLRAGALAAVHTGALDHARRCGAPHVDIGSTAPFLDGGLARYKRKWGFAPEPDRMSPLIAVRTTTGRAGVHLVLGGRPVLTATGGGLTELRSASASA